MRAQAKRTFLPSAAFVVMPGAAMVVMAVVAIVAMQHGIAVHRLMAVSRRLPRIQRLQRRHDVAARRTEAQRQSTLPQCVGIRHVSRRHPGARHQQQQQQQPPEIGGRGKARKATGQSGTHASNPRRRQMPASRGAFYAPWRRPATPRRLPSPKTLLAAACVQA
ncbi:hypothetical protein D3C73_1024830 [compost metagenome]